MKINTQNFNPPEAKNFYNAFMQNGFPNKKSEDWKFTDLEKILKSSFKELKPLIAKDNYKIEAFLDFDHFFLININGELVDHKLWFNKGSKEEAETKLTKISNINQHPTILGAPGLSEKELVTEAAKKNEMLLMYLAFLDRGCSFEIPEDLNKPLVIYNFFDNDLENKIICNSNFIKISNSKVKIIELNIDKSKSKYFKNTFQKYQINNSEVDYYFINFHNSNGFNYTKNEIEINDLNSKKGSILNYFIFGSGSKFRKDDYEISLNGENSFAKINSAAIINNGEHHEVKTKMFHREPNCKSHQKIKNILQGESKGIFQGKVLVSRFAQKTDAYQLSKGLILDDKSEFSTKPELEIYADDVKCSHGSNGNIDEDAVFYLMTRGLSARGYKINYQGFLNDEIEIEDQQVKKLIDEHLEKNINEEN